MSNGEQALGYTNAGQKMMINPEEGVRFKNGEDFDISVSMKHGELRIHSHVWNKELAAIGEAGNVLRLRVVER